ncbi:HD domain-containing protein [Oscillibacter sp.]|uniref:3'-5' exoribonuclease YhaM family protein n=1 Tax=Oscillibacter sp. TaxID=1945593 RepID=UPI00261953F6|nr:HD domain-containing protein [Oscillibacter sp.]MDD3346252.1 HD domain-containing protein [Oscillibacter sp.]
MEYQKKITEMAAGDAVEGFYILRSAVLRTGANGKTFLNATLCDKDGEIEAKAWDYSGPISSNEEGKIVKVRGTVSEYRGSLQMVMERLRTAEESDAVDRSALVPTAPIDAEASYREVEALVDSMTDGDYQAVCRLLLERHARALQTIPAAKSVHHSFVGGLLMHTRNMLRLADFLAGQYGDTVDRSLLLAGTLLHDFAKEQEFTRSELGLVTEYSLKGQLLGHLVMGAQEVARAAEETGMPEEKSVLLQHMILSHHGEPDFGAAVRPACAESELLSCIDTIDSRMEIYRESLAEVPAGAFSPRIFALEKKIYHHT